MIKNKLIAARKEKNKTQTQMAAALCITQSQYQRREKGEIHILDEEWARIAKFLEKEIEEIREDDNVTQIFNYDNNSGNYSASTNHFYNIPDFILQNQQEYIEMLKREIETLKTEVERLKNS
ncbi:MAG: helix-turn-helix domain-containing protein [Prevotellaceae bacterium]|jgi:transcriptional regulator with XRE-family HTH domain|nr:helix-turn-helix domain-containing protein [Prevotellaceae bacterium]